eukprot:g13970.t1
MAMMLVLLGLSTFLGTSAVSPCLDPADAGYSCEVNGDDGGMVLWYCEITDEDVDSGDLALCFDAAGRDNIVTLLLSNNELVTLPEDLFQGLTALEGLDVAYSGLEELPEGIFQGLTALERIDLHGNAVTLSEGIFQDLPALRSLYLHQMSLRPIPERIFQGLAGLTVLKLGAAGLTILPEGLFQGLTALEELYMDWNGLTTLPARIFEDLTSLTTLVLVNNDLECLPMTPMSLMELDDYVTINYAGGLDVDPYGDECGCSIPDVTRNVCGEETCTPGPDGYTCATAAPSPVSAPAPTVAPETSALATSLPATAPTLNVATEAPVLATPSPASEPTPTMKTEPPAAGTLAPESAQQTTPASSSSEGSMAPVEDWAAASCAVGSVCPGNQCCHPDLKTCGRKYTFCQERDLFNGVRCCTGTDGDPSELNVCTEDSICDAPEEQSTIERTEVWASILGGFAGFAATCAGLYKYCQNRARRP